MPKPRSLEAKLARLKALRLEPFSVESVTELRAAVNDKSNLVVADAAEIIGERLLKELEPELIAAFDRFLIDPEETDKLCAAKLAILETLNKLEYEGEDIYRTAIHHVQMEPRWGGSEDTATALRGTAAFGLVRLHCRDIVLLLVELLNDPEKVARAAAATALGALGTPACIPLLRFKALIGDKKPEVIAECLSALMTTAPVESLEFVAQFLNSTDEAIQEGAAFALAESRRPEALEILKQHWNKHRVTGSPEAILLAISMTRLPTAIDFLVELLAMEKHEIALAALSALAIYRHNAAVKERIEQLLKVHGHQELRNQFDIKFKS
jgi:HEAT repeat protein